MKKLISSLLVLAMLLSLSLCAAAESTEDPMEKYRTGSPWLCVELEGVVTEDTPASLKDDFALAVNRDFYINAEIPEGYIATGTTNDLEVINSEDMILLFQDGNDFSDHDSALAKAFYDMYLDWDARNALGMTPLKTETDIIEAMQTLDELTDYFLNYPQEKQLSTPFTVYMDVDLLDPETYVPFADSCSLLLDDSAEYSELTDLGALYQNAYRDLAVAMLQRLDYSEERAREMWDEAFRLDELMAPSIYTSDERNSPDFIGKIYNPMTRDEMIALQGPMPVVEYLEDSAGFGRQENWIMMSPAFFQSMQTIFTQENLPLLKSWIICHAAIENAKWLDQECMDLRGECIYAITGSAPLPDEVMAASVAQSFLPWQTAHMYCNRFFTQQDKDAVQSIIDDIIATYQEMLLSEDFISEETKAAALRKLDTMRVRCLFPDDWDAYTDPELTFRTGAEGGNLWEASEAIGRSVMRQTQEKVKKPVDHEMWGSFTPTTVNAFYCFTDNSINILAAYCRGNAYNDTMRIEEIYAKVGTVIGHEVTHAFDSTGAQFDETGAFRDWWTDEDKAEFEAKNSRLADYFNNMTLWDGEHVNGDIKTGESCADMGAMKCMLALAAAEEDFDYDLFFRSYADMWSTKAGMFWVQAIQKDTHPLGYHRINAVLQQFDEFLDCYGITEGDGMYLAPADRVAIW